MEPIFVEEEDGDVAEDITYISDGEDVEDNGSPSGAEENEPEQAANADIHRLPVDSPDDFQAPPKRAKVEASPSPDEGNSNVCPICLEQWSSTGEHRIVCLKCGHLFGKSCITRWIDKHKGRCRESKAKCPECNQMASKKDVRILWSKNIVTIDVEEKEAALNDARASRISMLEYKEEAARYQLAYMMAQNEMEKKTTENMSLRIRNNELSAQLRQLQHRISDGKDPPVLSPTHSGYILLNSTQISTESHAARVLSFDQFGSRLYVSKSTGLGAGQVQVHGILSLDPKNPTDSHFIPIHQRAVRDISYCCSEPKRVATTSLDKTLKITSMETNSVVTTYNLESPGWSCCWNPRTSNYIYCGMSSSIVLVFDLRWTQEPVCSLESREQTGRTPIHSLSCLPYCREGGQDNVALVGANMEHVFLWSERKAGHVGIVEGGSQMTCEVANFGQDSSCYSVAYDHISNNVFASFRNGSKPTTHVIANVDFAAETSPFVDALSWQGRSGSTALSRTTIFSRPEIGTATMACVGDGATSNILLWDVSSRAPPYPASELVPQQTKRTPILDIKQCRAPDGNDYLAAMTDTDLSIYQWSSESQPKLNTSVPDL